MQLVMDWFIGSLLNLVASHTETNESGLYNKKCHQQMAAQHYFSAEAVVWNQVCIFI